MTTTSTGEIKTAVLASHLLANAVDQHSAECVGVQAGHPGTRFEALEPI